MARQRPEPSEELIYLRKVISQRPDADDPADVQLAFYRGLAQKSDQWVLTQKIAAEEKYKAELAAWKKAGKKEQGTAEDDRPLDPCEVLVDRLIKEWAEA